jgi:hypothetical protein
MEKSLGKPCFEKHVVTIMLSKLFLCEKSCYDNFFDSAFFGIFLKIHEDTQKMPKNAEFIIWVYFTSYMVWINYFVL